MFCGLLTDLIKCQTLEVVTDNELLDLCRSENQVVALFSMYLVTNLFIQFLSSNYLFFGLFIL